MTFSGLSGFNNQFTGLTKSYRYDFGLAILNFAVDSVIRKKFAIGFFLFPEI